MELREYQKDLINSIKKEIAKGEKRIVAVLGCGGGKSVILADITKSATYKENRVLFLVHRKELKEQITNTFKAYGVNMRFCDVVSTQTYKKRFKDYQKPNLILIDEAHTNLATYKQIFEDNPNCIKIGFTATPTRLKEKSLGELFNVMVKSVSTQWLIDNNFLSDFTYFSTPLADVKNIKVKRGDYDQAELKDVMENKIIYEDSYRQWEKLAKNKKTMIYCASIEASKETVKEFVKHGVNAVHLDGTTPKKEREQIIKDFRLGKIKVLSNAMLFSEGYDDKEIECVLLLRPTLSLALHTQQAMRGMRYKEGKKTIIIDCVGNVYKFGLPTQEHEWSLEIKQKGTGENLFIKRCDTCFSVIPANCRTCPCCGFEFEIEPKESKSKKIIKDDLVEINKDFKLQDVKLIDFKASNWEEVVEFQKAKKYKFIWCIHYALKNNIAIPPKYNHIKQLALSKY